MIASQPRGLVVDDDRAWQQILSEVLADAGLAVDTAENVEDAIRVLREASHRVAVVDLSLRDALPTDEAGLQVLDAVRRYDPGCVSLLLTGFATVELAVAALNSYGAYTCLRKESFRRADFRELLHRVLAIAPPPTLRPDDDRPFDATRAAHSGDEVRAGGDLVLLVEDDAGWRSLLAELLAGAGYRVRLALGYGEALGYLRRETFELAVVDLGLASSVSPEDNRDGHRVLKEARAASIPALVVSGLASPTDIERAYAEYAIFAYFEKQSFDRAAFVAIAGEAAASGRAGAGEIARLTRRERDVLALLARGLTNKGIARELVISENTVKRYLKSIFAKLDLDSRAAAAALAASAGLR